MKVSVKLIILGSILFVGGIIFGIGGTVVSMIEAFDAVQVGGVADPDALAESISESLISTAIGIPFAILGFGLFIGGIIAYFVGKNKPDTSDQMA